MSAQHDTGFSHVALVVSNLDRSVAFYARFARFQVVHQRDEPDGSRVAWLSDLTRPFVLVIIQGPDLGPPLGPFAHLGVGCASRAELDERVRQAALEGCLRQGPEDYGPPVGYWAFLSDPDGHTLELSFGQSIGFTVEQAG